MKGNAATRFWAKVSKGNACWIWMGAMGQWGYGNFWDANRIVKAHRWAYEDAHGPIPADLTLDHLCRVTLCVNPEHLQPVSSAENVLRGTSFSAVNARLDRCKRGHPFDDANTYMRPERRLGGFGRVCRTCRRMYDRARTPRNPSLRGLLGPGSDRTP